MPKTGMKRCFGNYRSENESYTGDLEPGVAQSLVPEDHLEEIPFLLLSETCQVKDLNFKFFSERESQNTISFCHFHSFKQYFLILFLVFEKEKKLYCKKKCYPAN